MMFDLSAYGAGLSIVGNLFLIGMLLGLGIKAAFELVDFFKRKFHKLLWDRDYKDYLEQSEQDDLDACLERRELEVEFTPEAGLEREQEV